MQVNEGPKNPRERSHNCGLPCNGMFCCDWCTTAYLARRDAHRVARRRRAQSQPDKGSAAGAD
jgi:hypothetical protein